MRRTPQTRHHPPRRARRGLTLLELIVGVFIAVFLTAAAVAFAAHETRLMGVSRDRLDLSQSGRASLELLASDIRMAGGGVGFREDGTFAGLEVGPFTVGGCQFNGDGAANLFNPSAPVAQGAYSNINLAEVGPQGTVQGSYVAPTSDILIRYADGAYSTIAHYNAAGAGEFCADGDIRFDPNEIVVMRTGDGLAARTVEINTTNTPGGCTFGQCVNGCVPFTFLSAPNFTSSPGLASLPFLGGELQGGFKEVAWFVADNNGDGTLRRAVFDTNPASCVARDNNTGGAVADGVESLQVQVYQYITDPAVVAGPPRWVNVGQAPINTRFRTRVDLELVVRAGSAVDRVRAPLRLRLRTNTCHPGGNGCPGTGDFAQREVFRTSVEVKNASL